MNPPTIGFVGGGRVTRILLEGWARAGAMPARVTVFDPNASTLAALKQRHPAIQTAASIAEAAARDVVFLATHPPVLAEAAVQVRRELAPSAILVSLAPKFPLATLTQWLGGFDRIARANPNAPSVVGAGLNPIVFAPSLTPADRAAVRRLFAPLGDCPEVAEEKIEAYAVISAMGPTYLWFQLQALRELAVTFGLGSTEADAALERMVVGAVRTLVGSGLPPAEVMDLVPAKPLAEMEPNVLELYRSRLPAMFARIKPAPAAVVA